MKIKKILISVLGAFFMLTSLSLFACENGNVLSFKEISTLDELKEAFLEGGYYKLMEDVISSEGLIVEQDKMVMLDMNTKKIVCSNQGVSIENNGNLTIKNGTVYSTNVEAQGRIAIKNNNTLLCENMILGSKQSRGNAVRNFKTATLKDCTVDCCDNYLNGSGYAYPIANSEGEMTIINCDYLGGANGVFASDGGKITVKSGYYNLVGAQSYYMFYMDEGEIVVEDGTFVKTNNTTRKMAYSEQGNLDSLTVNGGRFNYNGSVWTKENN